MKVRENIYKVLMELPQSEELMQCLDNVNHFVNPVVFNSKWNGLIMLPMRDLKELSLT